MHTCKSPSKRDWNTSWYLATWHACEYKNKDCTKANANEAMHIIVKAKNLKTGAMNRIAGVRNRIAVRNVENSPGSEGIRKPRLPEKKPSTKQGQLS